MVKVHAKGKMAVSDLLKSRFYCLKVFTKTSTLPSSWPIDINHAQIVDKKFEVRIE